MTPWQLLTWSVHTPVPTHHFVLVFQRKYTHKLYVTWPHTAAILETVTADGQPTQVHLKPLSPFRGGNNMPMVPEILTDLMFQSEGLIGEVDVLEDAETKPEGLLQVEASVRVSSYMNEINYGSGEINFSSFQRLYTNNWYLRGSTTCDYEWSESMPDQIVCRASAYRYSDGKTIKFVREPVIIHEKYADFLTMSQEQYEWGLAQILTASEQLVYDSSLR